MNPELASLLNNLAVIVPAFLAFWKGIDKLFAYFSDKKKAETKELIKEMLSEQIRPIQESVDDIKKAREEDNRFQHQQFQAILLELRKD